MRLIAISLVFATSIGCGSDEGLFAPITLGPEHCRLPPVHSIPRGDPQNNEWWLAGPHDVASTVEWPECPPVNASTADGDPPRITYPAQGKDVADGRWPVIVFGHANSVSVCNPTDRYRSLHEQWASWGWIVYSVDASEQNCKQWTLAQMNVRVDKFDLAVEDLRRRNGDPRSPFHGHIRFDEIVAAGHSRGGAAAVALASRGPHWAGAISLQGGAPNRFQLGDTYTDRPVLGIIGELDKDLDFPHVDLAEELLVGRYSWHTLRRGNHSFTADGLPIRNTDDPDEILTRHSQIELTKFLTVAYLASNFGVSDGDEFETWSQADKVLYSHFGDDFARAFVRGSGFVSRWNLGPAHDTVWIDRFESQATLGATAPDDPSPTATPSDPSLNDLGLANRCEGLARCEEVWTYNPDDESTPAPGYRLPSSLFLQASDAGGAFETVVGRDVGEGWRLQARVRAEERDGTEFAVVIVSPDGERRVDGSDVINTAGAGDRYVQLDVALSEAHIEEVRFEMRSGGLHVDDLRLVAPGPESE